MYFQEIYAKIEIWNDGGNIEVCRMIIFQTKCIETTRQERLIIISKTIKNDILFMYDKRYKVIFHDKNVACLNYNVIRRRRVIIVSTEIINEFHTFYGV